MALGIQSVAAMAMPELAIVNSVVDSVKGMVGAVVGELREMFGSLKSVILSTVSVYRPAIVENFNRAVSSLQMTFGEMFVPIVLTVTRYVQQLANYFWSLPPSFKETITAAAKVGLVVGAVAIVLSTLAGAAATVLSPLGLLGAGIAGLIAGLTAIGAAFARTTGGAEFIKNALTTIEEAFAGIQAAAQAVWEKLAPVREQLAEAFSGLGFALSELLHELKPLIGAFLAANAVIVKFALSAIIQAITFFANALKGLVERINTLLRRFNLDFNMDRFRLPDVSRETRNAPRPVQADITTDLNSVKVNLEKQIIESSPQGEPEEEGKSAEDQIADNTADSNDFLEAIEGRLAELPGKFADAVGNAVRGAIGGAVQGIGGTAFSVARGVLGL